MIKIACTACDWWDEREVSNLPLGCPECGASVERASTPATDDGSWRSGQV